VRIESRSEAETARIAAQLAPQLLPGDVVILSGVLGAGKTTFVRGALRALGWEGPVRSPSYTLANEFGTVPPVLHLDLYRLSEPEDLGFADRLGECVSFVEWGERDPGFAQGHRAWRVEIEIEGTARRITIAGPETRGAV